MTTSASQGSMYEVFRGATGNFAFAIADVSHLISMHNEVTRKLPGRPSENLEVLKRAAVILTVTAWESYIEDTLKDVALQRIQAAASPSELTKAFNAYAQTWLEIKRKPPELALWAGDGWKSLLRARFSEELENLHTPSSDNIRQLSERYVGLDLTRRWSWPGCSAAKAATKLDSLIKLRGKLVHRGKEAFASSAVKLDEVRDGVELVKRLVKLTDKALPVRREKKV